MVKLASNNFFITMLIEEYSAKGIPPLILLNIFNNISTLTN